MDFQNKPQGVFGQPDQPPPTVRCVRAFVFDPPPQHTHTHSRTGTYTHTHTHTQKQTNLPTYSLVTKTTIRLSRFLLHPYWHHSQISNLRSVLILTITDPTRLSAPPLTYHVMEDPKVCICKLIITTTKFSGWRTLKRFTIIMLIVWRWKRTVEICCLICTPGRC